MHSTLCLLGQNKKFLEIQIQGPVCSVNLLHCNQIKKKKKNLIFVSW